MAVHFPRNPNRPLQPQEIANLKVREYFESMILENTPSWQSKPEIPSPQEIMGSDTPDDSLPLHVNLIDRPWDSKEQYIEAHYNLLREDSVSPLRDAVATLRDNHSMDDTDKFSIYESVYVIGITIARPGLALHIRFSTHRAGKNIVWAYSDRLRPGTLVALTPANDMFTQKCLVATVASRKLENVLKNPPEVDIYLASYTDIDPDPQKEWLMVEARGGYYEATRHTMVGLQKLFTESFPLNEQICSLNNDIGVPEYIQRRPILSFSSLSPESEPVSLRHDVLYRWPTSPLGQLDDSQWSALRDMLTKELAITQGPPGTGKTFTSLAALRILLANKRPNDPPILIAAQTNHALDQLIKQISKFEKNYVRMGSRSADFEIRKRTVFEIRRDNQAPRVTGGLLQPGGKLHYRMAKEIEEVLRPLTQRTDKPLSLAIILEYGLLRPDQIESLASGAEEWERADITTDPFHTWLGDAVTTFQYPSTGSFGFKNEDYYLEFEQLKELEMENAVHEDAWETLKEPCIPFSPGFCGGIRDQISVTEISIFLKESDLWKIPRRYRGAIYDHLHKQLMTMLVTKLHFLQEDYETAIQKWMIGKAERDHPVLRDANLVGMTTTGLSKYRGLIASVNPRIILIEEAAEVIEAPIAVACLPSLQHLILVGDHKQLRGHCAVDQLAKPPFNLEVSMFERLVNNGIDFSMLLEQRRMLPEIRRLIDPLYGNTLRDHPSVENRPFIPGMGPIRSYFLTHLEPEGNDSHASFVNEFEASMVIGLLGYLLKNGVPATDITILTFYQGQRKLIKRIQNKNSYTAKHLIEIATVDSYQGEENHIILLSLVRSNDHRGIGFLEQMNRACVALSRAKDGIFVFGNAECITNKSSFWDEVTSKMYYSTPRRIGRMLPLVCDRHRVRTLIRRVEDWDRIDVGCAQPCGDKLPCGHPCPRNCHGSEHDWVSCQEPCDMLCKRCNELCRHKCTPPHDHVCGCTIYEDPKAPKTFKRDDRVLKADSESEHESAYSTPPRGRSLVRRPLVSEISHAQQQEALRKWREFAAHGAIQDDYNRAGLPLPEHLRRLRPELTSEKKPAQIEQQRPGPSNDQKRLPGNDATGAKGEQGVAALKPALEGLLIDLD